jgi:hypothetical protein
VPLWCSESDIQLHLAHKLLNKLPKGCVHTELPIPLQVEEFGWELFIRGRISTKRCLVPDIVILDLEKLKPRLIAELRFYPIYWSFNVVFEALQRKMKKEASEFVSEITKALEKSIRKIKSFQKASPSEQELKYAYLRNVDKIIQIIKDFENKEGETIAGYLCIIDEFYPNIEDKIKEEIEKYNPPRQFKLLVKYYPAIDILERIYTELKTGIKSNRYENNVISRQRGRHKLLNFIEETGGISN